MSTAAAIAIAALTIVLLLVVPLASKHFRRNNPTGTCNQRRMSAAQAEGSTGSTPAQPFPSTSRSTLAEAYPSAAVFDVTSEEEALRVLQSQSKPVDEQPARAAILMVYTSWCGHCKSMMPMFVRAAEACAAQGLPVQFFRVNGQSVQLRRFAEKYKLRGYPTILGVDSGRTKAPVMFTARPDFQLQDFAQSLLG